MKDVPLHLKLDESMGLPILPQDIPNIAFINIHTYAGA